MNWEREIIKTEPATIADLEKMTIYKKTVTTELTDWIRVEWLDCAPKNAETCPECQEKIQPGDIILIVPNTFEGYNFVHESHYE